MDVFFFACGRLTCRHHPFLPIASWRNFGNQIGRGRGHCGDSGHYQIHQMIHGHVPAATPWLAPRLLYIKPRQRTNRERIKFGILTCCPSNCFDGYPDHDNHDHCDHHVHVDLNRARVQHSLLSTQLWFKDTGKGWRISHVEKNTRNVSMPTPHHFHQQSACTPNISLAIWCPASFTQK